MILYKKSGLHLCNTDLKTTPTLPEWPTGRRAWFRLLLVNSV